VRVALRRARPAGVLARSLWPMGNSLSGSGQSPGRL